MTTKAKVGAIVAAMGIITAIAVPASAAAPPAAAGSAATATVLAATVTAPQLQPWPVLRQGHNSSWPAVTVRSLQYLLKSRGAKLTVDGVFGSKTRTAVIVFQRAHHLAPNGVVGPATWKALVVTVKLGSVGPAVRAVQDQANFRNGKNGHSLNVDGVFGSKTRAWVIAFQRAVAQDIHGFPVDGIVGPATWQALVTEFLSG